MTNYQIHQINILQQMLGSNEYIRTFNSHTHIQFACVFHKYNSLKQGLIAYACVCVCVCVCASVRVLAYIELRLSTINLLISVYFSLLHHTIMHKCRRYLNGLTIVTLNLCMDVDLHRHKYPDPNTRTNICKNLNRNPTTERNETKHFERKKKKKNSRKT